MPTINKKRKVNQPYVKKEKTKAASKYYNTRQWRELRAAYLLAHPLCEVCQSNGIVRPAQEVHHIDEISGGKTDLEMRYRAFNPANIIALCTECHHKIHQHKITLPNGED